MNTEHMERTQETAIAVLSEERKEEATNNSENTETNNETAQSVEQEELLSLSQ